MLMTSPRSHSPQILKFPSLLEREETLEPSSRITLRTYYCNVLLPDISDQSPNSLKEDRIALNHWDREFQDVDIRDVDQEHLAQFKDQLLSRGLAAATVNKTWRELKSIFQAAVDDGIVTSVPKIKRKMNSRLIKESVKRQREILTEEELKSIWRECRNATYPAATQQPAPKLWRVALVLFWTYGPRTRDVFNLRWEDVRFTSQTLLFEAQKTSKLQGLPLTPTVIEHLKSIKGHSERVFPGFNSPGSRLKNGRSKRGYYTTWKEEITRNASTSAPVTLKNFRESMLTRFNGIEPGLGNWIAGHSVPGVSAQNYDLPTKRVRDAICSAPVPEFFHEIG